MRPAAEPGRIFRMASFRLAVLGTMLSTIGAIIVFALIYAATAQAARAEFSPIIAGDRNELLADAMMSGGSMRSQIELATLRSRHTFYALTDPAGIQRAGNIGMPDDPLKWRHLNRWNLPSLPHGVLAIEGVGQRLANGDILFVGENASVFARLNTEIAWLFAIVFGSMITLGMLMSLLIAAYSLKRVRAISDASHQIVAGDLSHRIKLYGIDDELDVLTSDLNLMLATIARLIETARQVSNDIAHDLRSPMTRLREQLILARRDAGAAAPRLEAVLGRAVTQADQLIGIFAAVLRIADIEAGAARGPFADVDLAELCRSIGDSYQPVAEDRDQSLTIETEGSVILRGDRALLAQMLVNVVENAIRHTPSGTAITLRTYSRAGNATIELQDGGPGIPACEHERVFDRFVRLEAARSLEGHGLGLALVRAIAAMHGGTAMLHDQKPGLLVRMSMPLTPG